MKQHFQNLVDEEEAAIDMTPMLDVVFIMLIFFIVTASFVKEAGIDVNRPEAATAVNKLTNKKLIEELNSIVAIKGLEKRSRNSFFSNKSVVFTGTLAKLSRDEAKYRAKTKGAKILSNVSSNTDYVVVGEKSGSKAEKAKNLGIKILSEEDFLKKISE